jgi:hypothetical protein
VSRDTRQEVDEPERSGQPNEQAKSAVAHVTDVADFHGPPAEGVGYGRL